MTSPWDLQRPFFQIHSHSQGLGIRTWTYLLGATIQPSMRCPLKCRGSIWAGVATNTLWTFLQMPKSHSQTCEVPRWVPVRLAHSGGGTVGPGTALFDISFPWSVFSCLFFFSHCPGPFSSLRVYWSGLDSLLAFCTSYVTSGKWQILWASMVSSVKWG